MNINFQDTVRPIESVIICLRICTRSEQKELQQNSGMRGI